VLSCAPNLEEGPPDPLSSQSKADLADAIKAIREARGEKSDAHLVSINDLPR